MRLIHKGGPYPYARDGVIFSNREERPAETEAGLLSGVHGEDAGRPHPRRTAHRRRERGGELYYSDDHYKHFRRIRE